MKNMLASLVLILAPLAVSAETRGLPAFDFTGAAALHASQPLVPFLQPLARPADVITQEHMLIKAGKEALFGYASTQEQFLEASGRWSQVLREAGIEPGAATLKDGIFILPYKAADGRVVRSFLADTRQFPPKDEQGLRDNMALALKALNAAGLTPVAARVVALESGSLLHTYSLLYLTKPESAREREVQLRVLKPGDDVPVELIRSVPEITVVQLPQPWLLVYVGPELGYVGLWARTPEDLAVRLAKRKEFLAELGKRVIAEKFMPIDHPVYKFGVEILFFQ